MEIKFKKVLDNAVLPYRATPFSAGYDLTVAAVSYDEKNDCWVYDLGFATEFDPEYVALIFPRSSNRKTEFYLPNSIGVVDSDFRSTWKVCLKSRDFTNLREPPYRVGERIGQMIIQKLEDVNIVEVDKLSETVRGEGAFGSTGK